MGNYRTLPWASFMTPERVERFLAHVPGQRPKGKCWEWSAGRDANGYGKFSIKSGVGVPASRFMFALIHGETEANKHEVVRHTCDNPPCVNPRHLVGGTHLDNQRDMAARGRIKPAKGRLHWNAKITEDDVREIRRRAALGEKQRALAEEFGLTFQQVWHIVRRRSWDHVT